MIKAIVILLALIIGVFTGLLFGEKSEWLVSGADVIGNMWLNALRMTVIPLVFTLLVVGIAKAASMARAGRMTARAIAFMIFILWCSSAMAAIVTPALLELFPLQLDAAAALRSALGDAASPGEVPPFSEFLRALIPTNVISAAAEDAVLPLMIFALAFAFAITRLPDEQRIMLDKFFNALADTLLIIIKWVLALAPLGVFALAVGVGAKAGVAAFGALLHYVLIVSTVGAVIWAFSYILTLIGAKRGPVAFFRASAPAQAVAISTQSSLASLPAMVSGVKAMGVGERSADVVLPISVALFRATGPCMNLAVAIYVAHLMGIELSMSALAIGIVVAAITTMGAVSLPGSISFITSIAPINIAMGLPIEPLVLLLAIETFPDIMRTVANVSMDMSVAATVARAEGDIE
ncbi:Na+/H+-dicarboxylate symporter [Parasphingorhabdus marina DSM 22363]|uniref:Na+/H+-dicarboxylate symporter n=1 Tax=Parasphingorhabdus marina DSM 22363 TaxID=1123272 RepID=A0A1N6EWT4_9SPHN|nr:dicarboxylate/amino acid:cation symporter [Parasphingorhabdus marina]SIN87488.1 Na+/H+-dicarboxylate symporter [Parasphingorhabdus marina DSM 22363]